MELTRIHLNLADRYARGDLADPYQMHSTLARAFARSDSEPARPFLWRLEPARMASAPVLLVQSECAGNWAAFTAAKPGWSARLEHKNWDPLALVAASGRVTFRLRANPSVCRAGKRHGLLRPDEQLGWMARQAERCGLKLESAAVADAHRLEARRRKGGGASVVVLAATFDGTARVSDAALLAEAVARGIGHAKMLGLGLLSIAPLHHSADS